ncbi:uncharacterized protein LOC110455617 [Mizuhopecten yessoensis]|uniref:uncharacterized protein LOC110455617 n=1 Tax=Mizuhopecten yessoensis TaxID=6573 RepID=UPI000B459D1E|nr:uncharacterized protein LOC110455617 [Mizuhopecten yessoensis]
MAESLTQQGGQIPIRVKGQNSCIYHHGKSSVLFCENCQDIACTECTSSIHSGHNFLTLSNVSTKKKKKLQKLISKKETDGIPSIRKSIKSIDVEIKETEATFESLAADVTKQRDKLKRKIDLLADQTLAVYEKLKIENVTLLKDYKKEHENHFAMLKGQIENCRSLIQTGDDITVYDSDANIESPVALPVKPTLNTASFSANLMPLDNLKQAFGTVMKDKNPSNVPVVRKSGNEVPKDKEEATEQQTGKLPEGVVPPKEQRAGQSNKQQSESSPKLQPASNQPYTPFSQPEEENQTPVIAHPWSSRPLHNQSRRKKTRNKETPSQPRPQNNSVRQPLEREIIIPITVMAKMRNGDTWIDDTYLRTIVRIDRSGRLLDTIDHRRQITDFSFSNEKQELWICSIDDNSVIEVTSAPPTPRFYTDESPLCICVTMDGHLIVGMSKQITKFNSQGGVIITTKPTLFSLFSKPIVCLPRHIAECPVTKNIAVADRSSMNVLVMDKHFNELFRYPQQTQINPSAISVEQFIPNRLSYHKDGCIIIEDIGNNTWHHTSGIGEPYGYFHRNDATGLIRGK